MSESHLWVVLYSAPEDGPKSTTGDLPGVGSGRPFLPAALRFAHRLCPPARVVVSVLEQEEPWWSSATGDLPHQNLALQPLDRGSGVGLLVTLLDVAQRDPQAEVVIFTSDEVCSDASEIAARARAQLQRAPDRVHLVGRAPVPEDTGGSVWIVPATPGGADVAGLVFAPTKPTRAYLMEQGAVVATPVVVGRVETLIAMFEKAYPGLVTQLRGGLGDDGVDVEALHEIYPFLEVLDFHHDVLARSPAALAVCPVEVPASVLAARGGRGSDVRVAL